METFWSGTSGFPWHSISRDIERLWNVHNLITWRITVLHSNGVQKWFYCTSDLLFLLGYSIILEISEIRAPNIGFDISIMRILCLLYTSPSPRDRTRSRMPSSA